MKKTLKNRKKLYALGFIVLISLFILVFPEGRLFFASAAWYKGVRNCRIRVRAYKRSTFNAKTF